MSYLITQLWFCLLVAAVIGAIIGWWLKRLFCRNEVEELDATWRNKLGGLERDRDSLQRQLDDAPATAAVTAAAPVESAAIAPVEPAPPPPSKPTNYPVEEVEGIGKGYGKKIREMGITTTQELLEKCCQMDGRLQVAEKIGIEDFVVSKWTSMCDLMRISGIRGQFAELMVYAGIDSAQDLAKQNPERLHDILAKSNQEQERVETVPSTSKLEPMINQAKALQVVMKDV